MSNSSDLTPWTVLNSTVVHRTPWLEVIEDQCVVDDQIITYTYVHRVDEGSTVIAEEPDGRLWLVQQYRHPIHKVVWQFPSEGGKPGETRRATAERGLAEELGKQAQEWIPLQLVYPDAGSLQQSEYYFIARGLSATSPAQVTHSTVSGEMIEVEELHSSAFTLSEIDQLIEAGEICDNWTFSALYLYQRYLHQHPA